MSRAERVLAPDYAQGLAELPLDEVRAKRAESEQVETDLSYLRRLLQGRVDILRAERARRSGGGGPVLAHLAEVLAGPSGPPFGMGRHQAVDPSEQAQRRVDELAGEVDLTDLAAVPDPDLARVLSACETEERSVSDRRKRVQAVMDALSAEVAARYKDGRASVADLLAGGRRP